LGTNTTSTDLERLREQVSEIDREIVEAINRRLEIVRQIWAHKAEHGLGKVDPERERWLREHLASSNRGPLSAEGLAEIHTEILALTKREMGR
jgi:chorismate mutase/prephenate dehydratase